MARELFAGLFCEFAEVVRIELLERGADDPELGHQPGLGEVQKARQELPPGEITGGPEEHDDVGLEGREGGDRRIARAVH
jgi:hypothetical protein